MNKETLLNYMHKAVACDYEDSTVCIGRNCNDCPHDYPMDNIKLIESALKLLEQDRWIPVTERLPEFTHFMYDVTPFSDTVLVTVRNQHGAERLVLGNYEQHRGWNLELLNSTDERFLWHVIAWRPLPKAYQDDLK